MSVFSRHTRGGAPTPPRRILFVAALGLFVLALGIVAYQRGGLLGLPSVPPSLTAQAAGLADLEALARRDARLGRAAERASVKTAAYETAEDRGGEDVALETAAAGLGAVRQGRVEEGLETMRKAVERAPRDVVLGNAYRMTVFHLRRQALASSDARTTLADRLPPALEHEPIAFFERLRREQPSREATLQLALAWVDELMLFPALEIKAPASVESVNLLSEILNKEPWYVPALYGRGLNYLHRPARLVWPEARKAAPDAASRDLGLCVAIGRKIGGGSPQLVSRLALALGDAYAREGKPQRARSWWQIAENSSHDPALAAAVRRRFAWQDDEMLDRLEAELEGRMLDLEHPLTDLSIMWR